MAKFISSLAAGLVPYVPGEQPQDRSYIKLNTNENPYSPSPMVTKAIRDELDRLRLYPDPESLRARRAAAMYFNDRLGRTGGNALDADHFFMGNGSDEVLALLCPAFFTGKKVAYPDITYTFYPVITSLFQVDTCLIPLKDDFSIDLSDYTEHLEDDVAGIFLCNPNAPTGRVLPLEDVETILRANPERLVIVDEAYIDFGAQSAIGLIDQYDNLLVVQTLSKSRQLAGMRIGFAAGNHELIRTLNTVKNTFNSYPVDRLANVAAEAAFQDVRHFEETSKRIAHTRKRTEKTLKEMGFDIIPSASNFLFVRPDFMPASELFAQLRSRGILVRYFDRDRIRDRLRITIGTDEEMQALVTALRNIRRDLDEQ